MQSRLGRSLRQEQVDYTYSYTMLFNGFALRTARKNLETIQSAKGVSRAFVAGSYTLPTVEQADTQALQVALATNQFTGKGMTIAVLDTGWIPPIPPLPTPRQTPNSPRTTSAVFCRRPTSTPRP